MLTMGRRRIRSKWPTVSPAQRPPSHQEERTVGCRGAAGSQGPPRIARSKASPGGRPSVGEVLKSLPPAEDPWSPRAPLASPLPLWWRPGFRSPPTVAEGGARRGPRLAI